MEPNTPYYQRPIDTFRQDYAQEDFEQGLSSEEAARRLEKFGYNELTSEKESKWKILLRQFNNMIIYILLVACLLTLLMAHYSDAVIIGLVVIANAFIGYYQEVNASNALEKIKEMLSTQATVFRDGERKMIDAEELVPGDVVFLEAGVKIPADLRIVDADNLRIQESALTGEADSVEKSYNTISANDVTLAEQYNMAFASTSVTNGSGVGLVVATAENTEIGKISTEVSQANERKTPLMQEIDNLGKGVTYVVIAVAVVLFTIGLFFGNYAVSTLSLAVVIMVVGSVPEGLPATTSVILAMGVSDMAKHKHTIVKTLPAVETLGSVDVIATDKTGTLTQNEMTVKNILIDDTQYFVEGNGYQPEGMILKDEQKAELTAKLELFLAAGFEANDTRLVQNEDGHWDINGEPTDGSFLTLYHKVHPLEEEPPYQEIDMLPFDSDYRYIAKLVQNQNGERIVFIKGSPDKLYPMAQQQNTEFSLDYWKDKVTELSEQGKRVVAVGFKPVSSDLSEITHEILEEGIEFLGLAGIIDPPRKEVIDALQDMKNARVGVKMITGDHPVTAKSIGEQLGLAEEIKVITGAEWDKLTIEEKKETALTHQAFARTTPQNKLEIVEALQSADQITAMTGDGVNDAPALKRADIGVSIGIKGTDVAKDSANMVLANDDFATMSTAIREGRRIYDNIKKSILFLLPTSFAEGLIIAFSILMQESMPLQATQMLWINMVSAITIQFAFIFEPAENGIMDRPPRRTGKTLMNKHDVFQMAYVSVLIAIISLFAHDWLISMGADPAIASTMMVNIIVFSKIFYLFSIRTPQLAFSKVSLDNPKAFGIIFIMIILQLILTYIPFMQRAFYTVGLSTTEWIVSIVCGMVILLVAELDKGIRLLIKK